LAARGYLGIVRPAVPRAFIQPRGQPGPDSTKASLGLSAPGHAQWAGTPYARNPTDFPALLVILALKPRNAARQIAEASRGAMREAMQGAFAPAEKEARCSKVGVFSFFLRKNGEMSRGKALRDPRGRAVDLNPNGRRIPCGPLSPQQAQFNSGRHGRFLRPPPPRVRGTPKKMVAGILRPALQPRLFRSTISAPS